MFKQLGNRSPSKASRAGSILEAHSPQTFSPSLKQSPTKGQSKPKCQHITRYGTENFNIQRSLLIVTADFSKWHVTEYQQRPTPLHTRIFINTPQRQHPQHHPQETTTKNFKLFFKLHDSCKTPIPLQPPYPAEARAGKTSPPFLKLGSGFGKPNSVCATDIKKPRNQEWKK